MYRATSSVGVFLVKILDFSCAPGKHFVQRVTQVNLVHSVRAILHCFSSLLVILKAILVLGD